MKEATSKINWDALEQTTHADPGERRLTTLSANDRFWDAGHLSQAAVQLATAARQVVIVTGFCRHSSQGMTAETDGPPGALFLARALLALGSEVLLVSDRYGVPLLEAGCDHWQLGSGRIHEMPIEEHAADGTLPASDRWCADFFAGPAAAATHFIAIERPGPSHTLASMVEQSRLGLAPTARFRAEVPEEDFDRCHNMRGERIDRFVAKTERLLAWITRHGAPITTIGIGDGGNEIGMGAIPWEMLTDVLGAAGAGRIVCRAACDNLLLAGVSDWGAYALALATAMLLGKRAEAAHWNAAGQAELLRVLVEQAGAVDGVTGQPTASVDGLPLDVYLSALVQLRGVLGLLN